MAPTIPQLRRFYLFIVLPLLAIIAAISYLIFVPRPGTYDHPDKIDFKPQPFKPDLPYDQDDEPTDRLSLSTLGESNTVICWPSIGGIIIKTDLTPIELDFLSLPRFSSVPRSDNAAAEDAFCRRLRLTEAKWYKNHWDYVGTHELFLRPPTSSEEEILHLGWPEKGGVWVMRQVDRGDSWEGMWRMRNAYTMTERCKALEMAGAKFYERPEESEYVRPLLEGFGEHEWWWEENDAHEAI